MVKLIALVLPLLDLVVGLSLLLTLIFGGRMAIYGEITIGQFVSFNGYVTMLVWPMIAVGESVSSMSQGMASLRRIRAILDEQPEIRDEGDPAVTALKGEIEFRDLTFRYPGSAVSLPALDGVSVHVAASLGHTGSGDDPGGRQTAAGDPARDPAPGSCVCAPGFLFVQRYH